MPVGHVPGYDVGVDYHVFGADIDTTGFIAVYNQPQVRQRVQTQLQQMADRGATSIQTSLWVENDLEFQSTAGVSFPLTAQEQANLRTYAQDVASVVSGQRTTVASLCSAQLVARRRLHHRLADSHSWHR